MKNRIQDDTITRVAILENNIIHINETLIRIEKRFDKIDEKLNKTNLEIKELSTEINKNFIEIYKQMKSYHLWTLGFLMVIFGSPIFSNITESIKVLFSK
jgi:peptidoglycan hydrolase CwlO-like protein